MDPSNNVRKIIVGFLAVVGGAGIIGGIGLAGFMHWGCAVADHALSGRPLPWYYDLVDKLTTRRPD